MKLLSFFMIIGFFNIQAAGVGQTITFSGNEVSLKEIFSAIKTQTGYVTFYDKNDLHGTTPVSVRSNATPLSEFLELILKAQPLDFKIKGKTIVLYRKKPVFDASGLRVSPGIQDTSIMLKGRVSDSTGNPVRGVSVVIKNSSRGATTDSNGEFQLKVDGLPVTLVFSSIGMMEKELVVTHTRALTITLTKKVVASDEVVVTGFFQKSKSSYTGAAVAFTGEQLKAISPTNLVEALIMVTPGMLEVEQKAAGSNPNRLPDILIRGVTSLNSNNPAVNVPLIVRDGTIISMQDLYDMNINEIATVTVLKDASAAALYGARAANGVIIIERNRITDGKMKINYNATGSIQFPDFSDYHILNAAEKLEYERLAGCFR